MIWYLDEWDMALPLTKLYRHENIFLTSCPCIKSLLSSPFRILILLTLPCLPYHTLPYPLLTFSPHSFSSFLPNLTISNFLWTSFFLCPSLLWQFFSFSPKPWGLMVSLLPAFQRRHLRRAVIWKLAKKNSVILTMKKRMRWDSLIIW